MTVSDPLNQQPLLSGPIHVGLVGTGYAARLRAEALNSDPRAKLVAVAGSSPERTTDFSETHHATPASSWQALLQDPTIDLVVITTVNRDHGPIVRAALEADKHVVVEYPLALDLAEAESLIALAQQKRKLLHVEHIELLSGIHYAIRQSLPEIGFPFYIRSSSLNPQHPAPQKWTYHPDLFGFPLTAAVSRIHRLTNLFGRVATVNCQSRYQPGQDGFYTACLCSAQLIFTNGLLAEVVYGKGESFWQASRLLEIQGDRGALVIDGEQGILIQGDQSFPLDTGTRRGLFAKDTALVLDTLMQGTPLYVTLQESLYALRVADAARRSAELGQVVPVG